MAFPTINGTPVATDGSTASVNKTVNLPASIVAKENIAVILRSAIAGAAFTFPAGWIKRSEDISDASNDRTVFAVKLADGSEGASIDVVHDTSAKFAAVAWRVAIPRTRISSRLPSASP